MVVVFRSEGFEDIDDSHRRSIARSADESGLAYLEIIAGSLFHLVVLLVLVFLALLASFGWGGAEEVV